ncbi:MAG: hypothetical protein ABI623_04175, partial [bacterium]
MKTNVTKVTALFLLSLSLAFSQEVIRSFNAELGKRDPNEFMIRYALERITKSVSERKPALATFAIETDNASHVGLKKNMIDFLGSGEILIEIQNIEIQEEKATVYCRILKSWGSQSVQDTIMLRKMRNSWKVYSSSALIPMWSWIRLQPKVIETSSLNDDPVSLDFDATRLLIRTSIFGTSLYSITPTDVSSTFGSNIFDDPVDVEMAYNGSNDYVLFFLDNMKGRLVAGKSSTSWVGSYGDRTTEYPLTRAAGMAISPLYEIFIVIPERAEIVKLQYNHQAESFTFLETIRFPGIRPSDIVYDRGWTLDPAEDIIWIADEGGNKIIKCDRQFNILQTIQTYFDDVGGTHSVWRPKKIMIPGMSWYTGELAFISGLNSLVVLDTKSPPSPSPRLLGKSVLPPESRMTSIGMEVFQSDPQMGTMNDGYLVTDENWNCVHKFDFSGNYVASLKSNPANQDLFPMPRVISGSCTVLPLVYWFNIGVVNFWRSSSGAYQNFFPGADVIKMSVMNSGSDFVFSWRFTNVCEKILEVVNPDGSVVSIDANPTWQGATGDHSVAV